MRVGIDATLVRPDRLTGIERYALSLASALARAAPHEIVLFTRANAPEALKRLPVEQHAAPFRSRFSIEQAWLPMAASRAGIDLLHMLAFPTPVLWRGRAVVTLHDATPWLYRDTCSAGMRYYYAPLYKQALARTSGIITVSESARRDLTAALRLPAERIHVTRNGVEQCFFEGEPPGGPRAPYLLAVGTLEPRKNIPVLVEAFRQLRREGRDLELVLVGRQGWADSLPLGDMAAHVRLTGAIPDTELAELYAGAACFVLPSLYEGFGLCLAEAMAAGVPAVASGIPALRELGGDCVRFADPESPGDLAAGIRDALDRRPEVLAAARRGREHVRPLTWDACAEQTLELYARFAGISRPHPRARPVRARRAAGGGYLGGAS
jgi:glycosyltransferase involved in cell wall biosynthesis